MSEPKVSILCSTYNHKRYIRQALDSFLMQECNFTFEILVNDDCSSDGTTEILKKYKKRYPNILRLNLHNENLYSKGQRNMMATFLLPKAKGKYIALCEGDDYWTDKQKLQKQVDFLEAHKDYSVCFHKIKAIYENNNKKPYFFPEKNEKFTLDELLRHNFIQTNSVLYRKLPKYPKITTQITPGDWYLHVVHAKEGRIHFIDEVMSVYRKHEGGIWWGSKENPQLIWKKHGESHIALFVELLSLFKDDKKRKRIVQKSMAELFGNLIIYDRETNDNLTKRIIDKYSEVNLRIIEGFYDLLEENKESYRTKINRLDKKVRLKQEAIERRDKKISEYKHGSDPYKWPFKNKSKDS